MARRLDPAVPTVFVTSGTVGPVGDKGLVVPHVPRMALLAHVAAAVRESLWHGVPLAVDAGKLS